MHELIGYVCRCEFSLPPSEWPIEGFPAWVVVDDVTLPMVKMRSKFAGRPIWVNAALIKTISACEKAEPDSRNLPAKTSDSPC